MPHRIYFDCDNTMGLPGCDIDDGMALLYLLGRDDIQLEAVTTSFGNSSIDRVHPNTERMFRELGIAHIPLKKGAPSREQRHSDASHFLATEILKRKRRVKLLITGSPTNIYAACLENANLLSYVDEMIFMGGTTEPLIIGGKQMHELNLASDPEATHYLLNCPVKKTIASAQLCLDAFFDQQKMEEVLQHQEGPAFAYLKAPLKLWFDFISAKYGVPGFHVWDIVAAVYITHPTLFDCHEVNIVSSVDDLKSGFLRIGQNNTANIANMPAKIRNLGRFWQIVFDAWRNVGL
jgi:inosine-uridine nucleoside N-ribohydrolase